MKEEILVLGITGSIGLQTIDVCHQEGFKIVGVSLNSKIDVLIDNLKYLPHLKFVSIQDEKKGLEFKNRFSQYEVFIGKNGNIDLLNKAKYTKVVNSIVGFDGLIPSIRCLQLNKKLCLANKESLVIGGELIKKLLNEGKGELFPIDSEHVALDKLLHKANVLEIKRMIITASGGSLREYKKEELKDVTIKEVLNHPTWKMGFRITVDSSTMVNKGFEFIEASYLFNWDINNISVLINDESLVHSALEFNDNSYLFEVGPSDMRIPISYALNERKRVSMNYKEVDFDKKTSINFRKFDSSFYPLFSLVLETFKLKGTSMAFFNRVDEETIKYFLNGKLKYLEMIDVITDIVKNDMINIVNPTIEDIVNVDRMAYEIVTKKLSNL